MKIRKKSDLKKPIYLPQTTMGILPPKTSSSEDKKAIDHLERQTDIMRYHKARYEKDLLLAEKERPFVRGQWICYYTDKEGKDRVRTAPSLLEVRKGVFGSCYTCMAEVPDPSPIVLA